MSSDNPWEPPDLRPGNPADPAPQLYAPPAPPMYQAAYGPPGRARPPMPPSVRSAVRFMWAGAVLTALQAVVLCGLASGASGNGPSSFTVSGGGYVALTGGGASSGAMVFLLSAAAVSCGGWMWMAEICKSGRNWGRVVSTVFFGLGVLALDDLTRPGTPAVDVVFSIIISVVGLLVIMQLWSTASGPYFKPPVLPPSPYYGPPPPQGW